MLDAYVRFNLYCKKTLLCRTRLKDAGTVSLFHHYFLSFNLTFSRHNGTEGTTDFWCSGMDILCGYR